MMMPCNTPFRVDGIDNKIFFYSTKTDSLYELKDNKKILVCDSNCTDSDCIVQNYEKYKYRRVLK